MHMFVHLTIQIKKFKKYTDVSFGLNRRAEIIQKQHFKLFNATTNAKKDVYCQTALIWPWLYFLKGSSYVACQVTHWDEWEEKWEWICVLASVCTVPTGLQWPWQRGGCRGFSGSGSYQLLESRYLECRDSVCRGPKAGWVLLKILIYLFKILFISKGWQTWMSSSFWGLKYVNYYTDSSNN